MADEFPTVAKGLRGSVRILKPDDSKLFLDHLLRLDMDSRRERFWGTADDRFIRAYAQRCFSGRTVAYGYFEDGLIRAAAELHEMDDGNRSEGEIAFSVERPLRNRGLGSALFRRVVALAPYLRYERLRVFIDAENVAMKALARKFHAHLSLRSYEMVGVIEVDHLEERKPAGMLPALPFASWAKSAVAASSAADRGTGR